MKNKLPKGEPDIILKIGGFPCNIWKEKDHFLCVINLKNNKKLVASYKDNFNINDLPFIKDSFLTALLTEYAETPLKTR